MTVVTLPEIMNPAFENRYGVPAFNAFDDITMDGLIKGAEESRSPLIIQISVKTIKFWGAKVIQDMFSNMAERASVPVTLHLDHCPDPEIVKECLRLGWNAVLFDGSSFSFEENFRTTQEIAKYAAQYGAHVEGEVVPVAGVEDDIGSETEGQLISIEEAIAFVKDSGIYCYAPAIGTAHGFYKATPQIRYGRMEQIVAATNTPMVLHGGSGLTDDVFLRLISLGTAKVNISTALKQTYADRFRTYLEERPTEYNPLKLVGAVHSEVIKLTQHYCKLFGSEGKA